MTRSVRWLVELAQMYRLPSGRVFLAMEVLTLLHENYSICAYLQ